MQNNFVPGPYLPVVCVSLCRGIWDTLAEFELGEIENPLYMQIPIGGSGFQTSVVAICGYLILYNFHCIARTCILFACMDSINIKSTRGANYLSSKTPHILQIISF